ncbi:hypothetical protein C8Q72DRAFT_889603 [Fomitopsis betulina]|nr:hypothetical protein C8Q72DRAFT_889603 [Fomitopsis betulina]
MTSHSPHTPVVPSTCPKLGPITRSSLRNIIAPKPRTTTSTADTAFPTRIPIRKKRDHDEIAPDENDSVCNVRQARLRQRCDSGSSVRTLTRARTPNEEGVRPRTSSQESVRTIRNVSVLKSAATPPALAKACSEPVHGTLSREERVSAIASISRTAAALRRTTGCNKTIREGGVNTLCFPSDAAAIPVARTSQKRVARELEATPVMPLRCLRRTQSHRELINESEKHYDRLDKICEASVEVYEAQVDEMLDEIRRAKAALNEEDEAVVRQVVNDIIKDPEVAAEAEALALSPKGRIIMDDLEEIPDMFSDEEDDLKVHSCEPALVIPRLKSSERFEVVIKPTSKHTTMWDVNFEDTYAWQGVLYVKDLHPHPDGHPPLPVVDIDIEWRTVDACARTLRSDGEPEYTAHFDGVALPGTQILAQMNPSRGICTQPMWKYVPPPLSRAGAGGAWTLRFWVPVPMHLFRGRDVRRFVLDARVMFAEWGMCTGVGHSERVAVTIEHLRRERDMKIAAR